MSKLFLFDMDDTLFSFKHIIPAVFENLGVQNWELLVKKVKGETELDRVLTLSTFVKVIKGLSDEKYMKALAPLYGTKNFSVYVSPAVLSQLAESNTVMIVTCDDEDYQRAKFFDYIGEEEMNNILMATTKTPEEKSAFLGSLMMRADDEIVLVGDDYFTDLLMPTIYYLKGASKVLPITAIWVSEEDTRLAQMVRPKAWKEFHRVPPSQLNDFLEIQYLGTKKSKLDI